MFVESIFFGVYLFQRMKCCILQHIAMPYIPPRPDSQNWPTGVSNAKFEMLCQTFITLCLSMGLQNGNYIVLCVFPGTVVHIVNRRTGQYTNSIVGKECHPQWKIICRIDRSVTQFKHCLLLCSIEVKSEQQIRGVVENNWVKIYLCLSLILLRSIEFWPF